MHNKHIITIEATVHAPIEKVWDYMNAPEHITKWNAASDDWHTTKAENELCVGGHFLYRMEAKDGSMGFDFGGEYFEVKHFEYIKYILADGRLIKIFFESVGDSTKVTESFEAEMVNELEIQQNGWQNILNNFKIYVESH